VMGARGKGNGGGDPALARDVCKDNNSKGGPMLATDAHHDDSGNGDVRVGPPPALRKETTYEMDAAAGAASDDAKCCHE
jgi:hypothetical protein